MQTNLTWDEGALQGLSQLCAMVPQTLRELAEASARDASEQIASERGSSVVETTDVVRGWIAITPPDQRDSLVPLIEQLGLDPLDYADELQSDAGWDEEAEESDDSER